MEQKTSVGKPKKGCCNCLNCFLILVTLFFVALLILLSLASASGLVKIPVFSPIFYKEPQVAEPKIFSQADLHKKFEPYFGEIQKNRKLPEEVELEFTEEEAAGFILGFLRENVKQNEKGPQLEKIKVLLKPEEATAILEIKLPSLSPSATFIQDKIWFTVIFRPELVSGKIVFHLKKARIGSLTLPKSAPNLIFALLKMPVKELAYPVKNLKNLTLSSGKIKVVLEGKILEKFLKK